MTRLEFEKLVREAIALMPRQIQESMDNVGFVIEQEPRRKKAKEIGIRIDETLLGLYEGIPRIERGSGYFGVLPDKITIFQEPIESLHRSEKAIVYQIRNTIIHEIAHHFGIDDDRLHEIESENRKKPR